MFKSFSFKYLLAKPITVNYRFFRNPPIGKYFKYLCDSDVTMTWIFQFQPKNYEAYFCEENKSQSDFKKLKIYHFPSIINF